MLAGHLLRATSRWFATLTLAAVVISVADTAFAGPSLQRMIGVWGGKGQIEFSDGQQEQITCRAYYRDSESGLGMALRCASPSYNVEIRSVLSSNNGQLSGSWVERTFNASGDATGRETADGIVLSVKGGGLEGSMKIAQNGSRQVVRIATSGTKLKGVSVSLSRMN